MRILHERFIPALFGNERHKAGNVGQLSAICHLPSSPRPSLPFCPLLHSVKKLSAAPCILKTRAILIPLEVYMVNSPSRPILRPDAPPNPVECGGRTPLWNRETCLPAHRMPVRNQTKSNHPGPRSRHWRFPPVSETRNPCPNSTQSRQKTQQSCLIKAHQGIRPKNTCHANLLQSSAMGRRSFPLPSSLRLCVKKPAIKPPQGSIKAKTPLIVHHQGISRQTLKFLNAVVGRVTPCAPSGPTKTPPLATIRMANQDILVGRRRRAQDCPPYLAIPFRVIRVFRGYPSPNQGKNPCNRASSRLIKASAQKTPATRILSKARRLEGEASPSHPLCVFALKNQQSSHRKAQSRQKPQQSRLIVHNQGKRQFFQRMLKIGCSHPAHPPAVI